MITTFRIGTIQTSAAAQIALDKKAAALRTGFIHRAVPEGLVTLRITAASVEDFSTFAAFFYDIFPAFRAFYTNRPDDRPCILTFRIAAAGKELAEPAALFDHVPSAFLIRT